MLASRALDPPARLGHARHSEIAEQILDDEGRVITAMRWLRLNIAREHGRAVLRVFLFVRREQGPDYLVEPAL
jgi:hypothetical protein